MLVITRKAGQTIELSGGIVITVRGWSQTVCKLTISAPPDVRIVRGELAEKVLDEMGDSGVASG